MGSDYKTGILFVHGIQGSPQQFGDLIRCLPDSVIIRNLLLPGHGSSVRQFRESGISEWLSAVQDASRELRAQCENLCFVGHSMGCLLGLLTEQDHPGTFDAMILICCPFSVRPSFRYFRNSFLVSFPGAAKGNPFVQAARNANSVHAQFPVQYLTAFHPYLELFRLIHTVKKTRFVPDCTLRFFYSAQDEIIGRSSVSYAENRYGVKAGLLDQCGHNYFTQDAKDRIIAEILFLSAR